MEMIAKPYQSISGASIHKQGGGDKIERYKWTVLDEPGELAMISKHELHIDPTYQRALKNNRVLTMASKWSWVACGAISVALRPPGIWMVMDGQHRVAAAKTRSDIDVLPCLVFDVKEVKEEAQGFLATNTMRKPMSSVDKFKALLVTGDKAALMVQELVENAGRRVGSDTSPSSVSCIGALMTCLKQDGDALSQIWPTIAQLCNERPIVQKIVLGLWYLQSELPTDISLSQSRWKARILQIGYDAFLREINSVAAFHGRASAEICAMGIARAINKGLRNPLPFEGIKTL